MTRARDFAADAVPGFISGFVSILGRPNAGKSTLLNALVGTKLAIVSAKPQTTRLPVQGVMNLDDAQVVFLDTPGIHEGGTLIHQRMRQAVEEALTERDLLLLVVDATLPFADEDRSAAALATRQRAPAFLVLNKIDKLKDKSVLLPLIAHYRECADVGECIPVSARTGEGLDTLKRELLRVLPPGPRYFPPDFLTDQPERYLAAELIREKVLELTRQEVPHAVAVLVEEWEQKARLVRIAASVVVERDGQKRILIGSGATMLKRIGIAAREEIEALLGRKVHLELFVKVRAKWRENPGFLDAIDWRYMSGGER